MRYLLTFFVLLQAGSSFAQQYVPFPTNDGATWRYYAERDIYHNSVTYRMEEQYMTAGDTIINGLQYKKVMLRRHIYDSLYFTTPVTPPPISNTHTVANIQDMYYCAYREDNKKVYMYSYYDTTERLQYDFNGFDTLATDSVLIGNQYHKKLTDKYLITTIEGIGSLFSVFNGIANGEQYVRFLCFTNNEAGYMQDSVCTYIFPYGTPTTINDKPTTASSIKAYPNPFIDAITIDGEVQGNAAIYNSAGIKVYTAEVSGAGHTIPTASFSTGMYMLVVTDKNGNITHKEKMVK